VVNKRVGGLLGWAEAAIRPLKFTFTRSFVLAITAMSSTNFKPDDIPDLSGKVAIVTG
jgi:hypothetical protein